jgi:hypothetical protein
MSNQEEIQLRFVELLAKLTKSDKIKWARSKSEPGFIHTLAAKELIVFEVRGGEGHLVDPAEAVTGVVSKCRNVSYLWLEPTPGFADLLELLSRAPIDDKAFLQFRKGAYLAPVNALELLL